MPRRRINIVGVGNVLIGDDGAGPIVVTALARCDMPPEVQLLDAGLAVSDVLGTLNPADPLIIIDSFRGGAPPGSIYAVPLHGAAIEHTPFPGCLSLHELSIMPALVMEALCGREFREVTVYGIEPQRTAWGEGLSAPVARAVEKLTAYLCKEVGCERVCEVAGENEA